MQLYSKTYTFSLFDKEFHMANRAVELDSHKTSLPYAKFDLHVLEIKRTMKIPILKQVLDDFKNGAIEVYITDSEFVFPSAIPVLLTKDPKHRIRAMVNITPYVSMEKDQFGEVSDINISDTLLMTLLSTAWFYRRWSLDSNKFTNNVQLVKLCSDMYAKIMWKVIDVRYGAGANYEAIDQTHAALAYFFASYFCESKYAGDIGASIPSIVDKTTAKAEITKAIALFKEFKDFNGLIALLNKTVNNMGKIDALTVVSEFGRLYNGNVIPAVDYLPFFALIVFSAYMSGGITKDYAVNQILRQSSDAFVKAISVLYP